MIKYSNARFAGALLLTLTSAACATKTIPISSQSNANNRESTVSATTIGTSMVVERFLRAANSKDLDTMAKLYGTKEGPFDRMGSRKEIDDRMFLMASVLKHSDYKIMGEELVPGRRDDQTQVILQLTQGPDNRKVTVPFLMTRYKNSWLIENIHMEIITQAR
jgi:hypothetical protein